MIGSNAFRSTQLSSVVLPEGVQVAVDAFDDEVVRLIDGVLNRANAEALIAQQGLHVVVPEGVTTINAAAFQNTQLSSVDLPSTLISIGNNAFRGTQINSVVIPAGTQVAVDAFENEAVEPQYDLDLNIILEGLVTSRGNVVGPDSVWQKQQHCG